MAFDAGIFSLKDMNFSFKKKESNSIFTLITNPKDILFKTSQNREPLSRAKHSTHIRILVFSFHPISSVQVFIDGSFIGDASRVKVDKPLFVLKWNSNEYSVGIHSIKVIVKVCLFYQYKIFFFFK